MSIGSVVYSTCQGLGVLARDFYDNGIINEPVVLLHEVRPNFPHWYRNPVVVPIRAFGRNRVARNALLSNSAVLFFETPFDWGLIPQLRAAKIKTVLMLMYECTPAVLPYVPDVLLSPSKLDQLHFPTSTFVPVPVNQPFKLRRRAEVFVHNAGNGGLMGRNGTSELIQSLSLVRSPIKMVLRSQKPVTNSQVVWDRSAKFSIGNVEIDYRLGTHDATTLYSEGDVFLFPEKFNGLSLPIQEAFASGMPVMCLDRFPMNDWLPRETLIPVSEYERQRVGPRFVEFDAAVPDPRAIAATIDSWYGRDVSELSALGQEYATKNSWAVLGPTYREILK